MIPFDTVLVYLAATIALALAPGPDNIFVLTQSALYGPRAGILVTLGLCTGVIVHTIAVALGVAAIFATSAIAFNVLKFVGAAYLLYLAWGAFRAGATDLEEGPHSNLKGIRLYVRGVIMNITNPKVAIFFLAFLPQFADPARGPLSIQIVVLGALFIASALVVFSLIAWFAGYLGEMLRSSSRAQIILNRLAGTIFAALAIRLAVAER